MNKLLIFIISSILITGVVSAASGSFGEVASLNACHCLIFNSTNRTNVWTLYSSFNTSVNFSLIKPNLTNTVITTSVINGIIQPNSYYPINVMIVSNSPINQSGYITAYIVSNTVATSGGAIIRIGASKLIKIAGNTTIKVQTLQQQRGSNQSIQSTSASTTIPQSVQITQNKSASTQAAVGNSASSTASIPSYLIGAVVVLVIVVCGMGYYIVKGKRPKYKER